MDQPMDRVLRRTIGGVLVILAGGVIGAAASAQEGPRLAPGGSHAARGVHSLHAGFTPDPFAIALQPVGALHITAMRLGPGCRGFTTAAEPDVIVRFSGAAPFLRFFVRSHADVTLVVHDPAGRYLCNDDVIPGRDLRPMVDVYQPRAGQYDVWVGTYAAGERADATLFITQMRSHRP
jgi:hypothetical protein